MISPLPLFSFSSIQSRPSSSFGRRDSASAYNVSLSEREGGSAIDTACTYRMGRKVTYSISNHCSKKIFLLQEDSFNALSTIYSFCFKCQSAPDKVSLSFNVFAFSTEVHYGRWFILNNTMHVCQAYLLQYFCCTLCRPIAKRQQQQQQQQRRQYNRKGSKWTGNEEEGEGDFVQYKGFNPRSNQRRREMLQIHFTRHGDSRPPTSSV